MECRGRRCRGGGWSGGRGSEGEDGGEEDVVRGRGLEGAMGREGGGVSLSATNRDL